MFVQSHYSASYSSSYQFTSAKPAEEAPVAAHKSSDVDDVDDDIEQSEKINQIFDSEALVSDLYEQLSSRVVELSGGDVEKAKSLWASAKAGIEEGFAQAKDMIIDQDAMNDELSDKIDVSLGNLNEKIDQAVNQLDKLQTQPQSVNQPAEVKNKPQNRPNLEALQQADLNKPNHASSRQQSMTLQLLTQEGDEIEILINKNQKQISASDGYSLEANESWSYSVQGDLNEDELNALDGLLSDIQNLSDSFYKGNINKAFDQAVALELDPEQFLSMDLNLKDKVVKLSDAYAVDKPAQAGPWANLGQWMQDAMATEQKAQQEPKIKDLVEQNGMNALLEFVDETLANHSNKMADLGWLNKLWG